ncbi:MAG: hypothetical protein K9G26_03435 [Emcibacter sp.]|nr:hypothetical protein [Emcibacter sp.]
MDKRTEISITIDTEFSIGGALSNPEKYKPVSESAVLCRTDGEEHGLGFLLEAFNKYNISASFFVECANYFYFGDEPMKSFVKRILDAGLDTQLHIHPCWLNFNQDKNIGTFPTNDSCAGRDYDELRKIFELCIEVFQRWTGKRPEAIRTGSLVADLNLYKVMRDLEIPLASNIALGVFQPDEPELQIYNGYTKIEGVTEFPVFSYNDMNMFGRMHIKSLQITSCSWPEMKYILWNARKLGIQNIVILTHPFEYIKKADMQYNELTRNRVNKKRLEKLCKFIAEHDQDFVSVDFSKLSQAKRAADKNCNPLLRTPSLYTIGRKIHNKINDSFWYY